MVWAAVRVRHLAAIQQCISARSWTFPNEALLQRAQPAEAPVEPTAAATAAQGAGSLAQREAALASREVSATLVTGPPAHSTRSYATIFSISPYGFLHVALVSPAPWSVPGMHEECKSSMTEIKSEASVCTPSPE